MYPGRGGGGAKELGGGAIAPPPPLEKNLISLMVQAGNKNPIYQSFVRARTPLEMGFNTLR